MNQNRRFFLKSGGLALASVGLVGSAPSFLRRVVEAQGLTAAPNGRRKTLITIFQRGAVDGLNGVVPGGGRSYDGRGGGVGVGEPGRGGGGGAGVGVGGFFGLGPSRA